MPRTPPWLQSILEEHFEELGMLWELRQDAVCSPDYLSDDLRELEERIEAHTDGLVLGKANSLPILEQGLTAEGRSTVFAAAYTLLRLDEDLPARRVFEAFLSAPAEAIDGFRNAFCHGPIDRTAGQLADTVESGPAFRAVAATEALACHRQLDPRSARLAKLLADEDPAVRAAAWRVVSLVDAGAAAISTTNRPHQQALRDESPLVRREALLSAAWTSQPWLLEHMRNVARIPEPSNWDALWLLAVLGEPTDLAQVMYVARTIELGCRRLQLLSSFGHPSVVGELLKCMESTDANLAVAAGVAFCKMTGVNVDSVERVALPPEGSGEPDEFEKEFLEEAFLPDHKVAREKWRQLESAYAQGTRWRRGVNVNQEVSPNVLAGLDMESRWEISLRNRFTGRWSGTPADLEAMHRHGGRLFQP